MHKQDLNPGVKERIQGPSIVGLQAQVYFKNVSCLDQSWLEIQFDDAQLEFPVNILLMKNILKYLIINYIKNMMAI